MTYLDRGATGYTYCLPLFSLPAWRKGVPGTSPVRIGRSGGRLVETDIAPLPGIVLGQPYAGMEAG